MAPGAPATCSSAPVRAPTRAPALASARRKAPRRRVGLRERADRPAHAAVRHAPGVPAPPRRSPAARRAVHSVASAGEALGNPGALSSTPYGEVNRRTFVTVMGGMLLASTRPVRGPSSEAVARISAFARPALHPPPSLPALPRAAPVSASASGPPIVDRLRPATGSSHDFLGAVTGIFGRNSNQYSRWFLLAARAREAFDDAAAALRLFALGHSGPREGTSSDLRLRWPAAGWRPRTWPLVRRGVAAVTDGRPSPPALHRNPLELRAAAGGRRVREQGLPWRS